MSDPWQKEFNILLYDRKNGIQICDLLEGEERFVEGLRDLGMTPEEAFAECYPSDTWIALRQESRHP